MSIDRGSSKHSPRLDDEMTREVLGHVQGSPEGGRAEPWREPEPSSEGQPEVSWVPEGDRPGGAPAPLTATEVEARSELGQYLPHTVFPADALTLRQVAAQARAPDHILAMLDRLPAHEQFATVSAVWARLDHHNEEHRW